MQVSEIQDCCERMIPVVAPHYDAERDLYHLSARLEGVLQQIEELERVSERLLRRPLRGVPDLPSLLSSECSATSTPAAETASLIVRSLVSTRAGGEDIAP